MNKKSLIVFLGLSTFAFGQVSKTVSYFPLNKVALSESIFSRAMQTDKNYIMSMDADRLLAPYLKEAGLNPKKPNYPNWENTGLDGHIGGHYISALALMYASTGDAKVKQRLDCMIDELERCQNLSGNGYISGVPDGKKIWKEISDGNIRASAFGLNDRWVPLYNIHKIYSGLRDAYWYADSEKAKKMLIKLTDWMADEVSGLTDEQIQEMLKSEQGGLNEVFADVYDITKNEKYLKLAHRFSHWAILNPLLIHEDKLTGIHANTQIPKVIGFKKIADLEHNKEWSSAAVFFWNNVTQKRSAIIGGNSVSEHFNPTGDFSGMIKSIEGPETCNTYNMLKLTRELFATNPKSSYLDYYERALYNHILSTQHQEKGGFVYFTPMRPGHYRVYSQPETSFWCCVGSGMENHAKYGEMIYAHSEKDLYVNLFIPSVLKWSEKKLVIRQENNFPQEPSTKLIFDIAPKSEVNLKIRVPEWTDASQISIFVNSKTINPPVDSEGYINISRKWKKGDVIEMKMPMHLSTEQLPDNSDYYAFRYGPIVLAAKYGKENQTGLFSDDSRGGHIAHGPQIPLNDIPTILGSSTTVLNHLQPVNEKDLKFKISGLYPQNKFRNGLELVPFYQIQEERYIIYFPQATQDKIEMIQKQKAKEEAEIRKQDNITTDKIQLGEQQPESDHFFDSKDSNTGYMEDRHFREAKGWFSYQMKNKEKNAKFLYITYFDANNNRTLNAEINGIKTYSKNFEGKMGGSPQTLLIPIPESEIRKEILNIKFNSGEKSLTPKIIEVRLLNQTPDKN
ncbi:glycoside hydrolase family 127 protein [Chryseobacterium gambrini]|uniref:Glycoside hydrolase family 127 protein n=1 Tax=Chryseobacterium gambrini TaxID=373672 RepID=A0ABM8K1N4_9FLAO|nr:glycoside hydrolase family 127 protein [Chryseobacterium gambrini]